MGSFGQAPDILVIDGKHRLQQAINRGEEFIDAYAGENIVNIINKEKNKLDLNKSEIIDLIKKFFKSETPGSILRILKSKLTDYDIDIIRKARKNYKLGLSSPVEFINKYGII